MKVGLNMHKQIWMSSPLSQPFHNSLSHAQYKFDKLLYCPYMYIYIANFRK